MDPCARDKFPPASQAASTALDCDVRSVSSWPSSDPALDLDPVSSGIRPGVLRRRLRLAAMPGTGR